MSNYDNIKLQQLKEFIKTVLDAGLNFDSKLDAALFQQAQEENPGLSLQQTLAIAASNKDGVQLLSDYNDSHPLGQTDPPTPRQADQTPQANRSGFDILDQLNRENPL